MITALLIILAVLIIALWISTMALWYQHSKETVAKVINRDEVLYQWNKAARLARRSWYGGLRYTKQAAVWGNHKARTAFIVIFPKSKAAFVKQDMLIGLEHGPSSYFLASLSKKEQSTSPKPKRIRMKKVAEIITSKDDLSE